MAKNKMGECGERMGGRGRSCNCFSFEPSLAARKTRDASFYSEGLGEKKTASERGWNMVLLRAVPARVNAPTTRRNVAHLPPCGPWGKDNGNAAFPGASKRHGATRREAHWCTRRAHNCMAEAAQAGCEDATSHEQGRGTCGGGLPCPVLLQHKRPTISRSAQEHGRSLTDII
jgi:hypothetical protein